MKKILIALIVIIIVAVIIVNSRLLSSGDEYRPEKAVVNSLVEQAVKEEDGRSRFGKAFRELNQGNIVIHLYGSPYEMGYQQGILLRDEILNGTVPKFADPISNTRSFEKKSGIVKWLMLKYLEFKVYAPIERSTPAEYLQEIAGIADGSGLPYEVVFRGSFLSDVTMDMIPGVVNKNIADLGLKMECSDFVATGTATSDGSLLVGRNSDYGGQGRWGKNQVIVYYHPDSGNDYVKVSSAGLLKCNSAMNEKGITVGGHFMAFEGTRPEGFSFTILENEIMRKAGTLDEALSIVKSAKRSGSFSLMLSDGGRGEAAVVEAAGDHIGIRKMKNDSIVLTNHATTDEMKPFDLMLRYNLVMRDMKGRYSRLEQLIDRHRGEITPALAAAFMGDHVDFITEGERGTGVTVCAANNVTSVVFQPAKGNFWVATGSEPACSNPFIRYSLSGTVDSSERLAGYKWMNDNKKEALERFMQAYATYAESSSNDHQVMDKLKEAIVLDDNESIYHLILARMKLLQGEYDEALSLLERAISCPNSNNEKAVIHLFKGITLDLMDRRSEAVGAYKEVSVLADEFGKDYLAGINDIVAGFALKFQSEPFDIEVLKTIPFSFSSEGGIE